MKNKITFLSVAFFLLVPAIMFSQTEKVDLTMVYKIKQEGLKTQLLRSLLMD